MTITKELKNSFISFCHTEFPKKNYCANENDKTQWFYVQAGNTFGNSLHYEFGGNEVQLHIELPARSDIQKYLTQHSISTDYEWIKWQNKNNHCCILKQSVANNEDVFNAFRVISRYFEPLIEKYEKAQKFTNSIQPIMDENNTDVELFTKTLQEIFQVKFLDDNNFNPLDLSLSIPDYQRIYCWREKNVLQLLDDLNVLEDGKPYHLGSIILHKTKHSEGKIEDVFAIVDGQQRLVTLALILNELEININLRLLDERFESKEAINYIGYNKYLIRNYIKKNNLDKHLILKNIRLSVLIINNGSLDLAYTFFSTQNARGKSLTDFDLLKAHHLRFIHIESQAMHLAERWDNIILNSDNDASDKDLGKTFGTYLFRLRKWMRKKEWSDDEKFKVKNEFEAAITIPAIPPFGEKFNFYESIQGGSHFFAYADHFIYKYKTFSNTSEYQLLQKHITGESHWWYRDIIEGFLFAYFLKFGTIYLSEATLCIEKIISDHRYNLGRSSYKSVLYHAMNSEIIMMIDQATSPTFFLAEAFNQIKQLNTPEVLTGIRIRYNGRINQMYNEGIKNWMTINTFKNLVL